MFLKKQFSAVLRELIPTNKLFGILFFVLFSTHSYSVTLFQIGDLQTLDTTIENAFSGEVINVVGDYYVNNNFVTGSSATNDILIASSHDQFFRVEDERNFSISPCKLEIKLKKA